MIADRRGVLDMPVKLAVAVIVLATMTPVVMGMADDAERSVSLTELESEAGKLARSISEAYYGRGPGDTVSVTVSLPPGDSLEIGGEGGLRYSIRLISDGEEVGKVPIANPMVPVFGDPVRIEGDKTLILECVVIDGVQGVRPL